MSINFDLKLLIDSFKNSIDKATQIAKDFSSTASKSFKEPQKDVDDFSNKVDESTKSLKDNTDSSESNKKKHSESSKQVSESSSQFKNLTLSVISANLATAALQKGMGIVIGAFEGSIEAAAESEKSLNALAQSMKVQNDYSEGAVKAVEEWAATLQKTTIIEDDAAIANVALAKSLGMSTQQAMDATLAAANLSSTFGGSLSSNTELLAKSMVDGKLPKGLIALKGLFDSTNKEALKNGAAIDVVNSKFGDASSKQLDSYSGKVLQIKNYYGGLQEEIGFLILKNSFLIETFGGLSKIFESIGNYIKENSRAFQALAIAVGVVTVALTVVGAIAAGIATIGAGVVIAVGAISAAVLAAVASVVYFYDEIRLGRLKILKELASIPLIGKIYDKEKINKDIEEIQNKINSVKNTETQTEKTDLTKKPAKFVDDSAMKLEAEMARRNNESILQIDKEGREALASQKSAYAAQNLEVERARRQEERVKNREWYDFGLMDWYENSTKKSQMEADYRITALQVEQANSEADLLTKQTNQQTELDNIQQHELNKAALLDTVEAQKKATEDAKNKYALDSAKLRNKNELDTLTLHNKNTLAIDKERLKSQKEMDAERAANQRDTFSTIATLSTANNKSLAAIGKAAGITQIAIDTPVAIGKALAAFPPPFNFVAAALVGTAMAAQAARISGIQFAEGGFVGGQSFSGDKVGIQVNSGEAVLNTKQQKNFMEIANGEQSGGGFVDAINRLGDRIANMEIKLFSDDTQIALATSRGTMNGVVIGRSR